MARKVRLREERNGSDVRNLWAYLTEGGALVIEGQDLGPATAAISNDGEYEWSYSFQPNSIPALCAALGGSENDDILDLLERRYTGVGSYDLERILRATRTAIPRGFWSWSG
jgi:hypothetical protein